MLGMRYACKLRQYKSHPAYEYVFSGRVRSLFGAARVRGSKPFCLRVRHLLADSAVQLRGIRRINHPQTAPWTWTTPEVDLSLTARRKSEASAHEFKAVSLEHIAFYNRHVAFYTDGSKTDVGVGCSFICDNARRSFTLPAAATVYTAELLAIYKALCFIQVCTSTLHVLFTDSLSSLLALKGFYPPHPVVQDIVLLLTSLRREDKKVVFCWIPSHVGIVGNELADKAARRAAEAPVTRSLQLPARDYYRTISQFLHQKWQERWSASNSKLIEIKPRLAAWSSAFRKARREEVILSRLRTGHTFLTHRHLLRGESRPICQKCGESLTVYHILCSCRELARARSRHFGRSDLGIKDLLGDDSFHIENLFRFIADVKFEVIYSPV